MVEIWTRNRGKLKIKISFVISRLTKYINNTTSISLIEMGFKKDFVHARKQSNCELCVFFPDLLFYGFLISYVCIINASFYMIKLYEILKYT
jgi:hypothetical protein